MAIEVLQNGCILNNKLISSHGAMPINNLKIIKKSGFEMFGGNGETLKEETTLQKFYDGKNIFVTGGTGFVGKILIEKLLRSCPGVKTIYLLVRQKKGKDVNTRIEEILDDAVFKKLETEKPTFRQKIVAVPGDCSMAGLGLSSSDRDMLMSRIDLVFHAAATVKFDEKLRTALAINVHGVRDMMALCRNMRNLKALIHVSTVYSNCALDFVEEKFYPFPDKVEELETLVNELDDQQIEERLPKILGSWPNTYTYTKALAENVIRQQSQDLNMAIFRPAIVLPTASEPVEGWIDNFYGPTGVLHGINMGVLRTFKCVSSNNAELVPVDYCVNALLSSAWDVANSAAQSSDARLEFTPYELSYKVGVIGAKHKILEYNIAITVFKELLCKNYRRGENMFIYNYVSSVENPTNWEQFIDENIGKKVTHPFSSALWYSCFYMTKSATINKLYMVFLHYIPGILFDMLALCVGRKPRLLKMYKKIHKFSGLIEYFSIHRIRFSNDNVQNLWEKLGKDDEEIFNFSIANLNWRDYYKNYIPGLRRYLLKEDDNTLESARRRWKRLYYLHQLVKLTLKCLFIFACWKILKLL